MPLIALVPATLGDLPTLATFVSALRREDPMPATTRADDTATALAVRGLIENPSLGRVWLIRVDERFLGYAVLSFFHSIELGGRCGFLDELYVEPAARGRGVGRRTIELVGAEAKLLGVRVLLLEVTPENEPAVRLYTASGFGLRKYALMSKLL